MNRVEILLRALWHAATVALSAGVVVVVIAVVILFVVGNVNRARRAWRSIAPTRRVHVSNRRSSR